MVQDPPPRQELIPGPQNSVGTSLGRNHPPGSSSTCNQNLPIAGHIHSATQTSLIKRDERSPL